MVKRARPHEVGSQITWLFDNVKVDGSCKSKGKGKGALFILGKYYQHSWWGRIGGICERDCKQFRKEKPLELPPRMKNFLLLPAAGIEPTTSWFGASLRIPVHHTRPLGPRISPQARLWFPYQWIPHQMYRSSLATIGYPRSSLPLSLPVSSTADNCWRTTVGSSWTPNFLTFLGADGSRKQQGKSGYDSCFRTKPSKGLKS